ncbi:MAG: NUDIX domain-containing protein [Candidatus Aenigmarchaeota archaeon]|nr:NUDIX domain-containing protein [Candidatus Aenigmarchaeota archaeon]
MYPIPRELYARMLDYIPMVCVDLIVAHEGRILLVKREREPLKGQWLMPGGRVFKGETLADACVRKAKEELGLDVRVEKQIGVYETFFDKAFFPEVKGGTHTVNIAYLVAPTAKDPQVRVDQDHSAFRWASSPEGGWHPYLRQIVQDSGIFGK